MQALESAPHLRVRQGSRRTKALVFLQSVADKWGVLFNKGVVARIDPKQTEAFLLSQPEVLDASVWLTSGQLQAHVTVSDEARIDRRSLQRACLDELGLHQTPAEILLIQARARAA
ncbi:MAG TPA: hypothetical protein VM328_09095 [Fimbriimonadaceae bacterium]|nr:hypothetical protein [Fimbriimonadaceae bacterium]